ncbi:MAG: ATP-binding protein [Verrucomicrobia bacterium]|nr:ATP-binding protein [Verrucomicrobiota bacterium]MBS0637721.1 ATP-binding protein [Verrucomicrobiota bacterium]
MTYIKRILESKLQRVLIRLKSVLLLGPRQTGKTTLIKRHASDLIISMLVPKVRRQYEKDPDRLIREVEQLSKETNPRIPLVVIDEVQKVPILLDAIQYLIDNKTAQFILTGSSARKLKHGPEVNLLPGRVLELYLDPLSLQELPLPLPEIKDLLTYGSLPAIRLEENLDVREEELSSYVDLYLEDEIRAEALVRNLGAFENFIRLAAIESGNIVNFEKISQDVGVARTTIASYYQILEDCLITFRIEPFSNSRTRKKLVKSPKYLFFDLGIRRVVAEEPAILPESYMGPLFEQFVGIELMRWIHVQTEKVTLMFWRDANGPEVDWVLRYGNSLLPIEVKWTDSPSFRDAKHLVLFMRENSSAQKGYVICQTPINQKLDTNIEAISWKNLPQILDAWVKGK